MPAIARNMEKIAKAVEQLQSGYSRLKVITFDQRDMKREGKESAAQYKRLRAQAKAAASTKSGVVREKC